MKLLSVLFALVVTSCGGSAGSTGACQPFTFVTVSPKLTEGAFTLIFASDNVNFTCDVPIGTAEYTPETMKCERPPTAMLLAETKLAEDGTQAPNASLVSFTGFRWDGASSEVKLTVKDFATGKTLFSSSQKTEVEESCRDGDAEVTNSRATFDVSALVKAGAGGAGGAGGALN